MKLWQRIRVWLLRRRLATIYSDIEIIERGRIVSGQDLDRLMRIASNLRADLWFAEHAGQHHGATLRGSSAPLRTRNDLHRFVERRAAR